MAWTRSSGPWAWTRPGRWRSGPRAKSSIRLSTPSRSRAHVGNKLCKVPMVFFRYANGITVKLDNGSGGGGIFLGEKGQDRPVTRGREVQSPSNCRRDYQKCRKGRQPRQELAEVHPERETPQRRCVDRSPFGHDVPPGKYRTLDRTQAALGSGQGDYFPTMPTPIGMWTARARKPYELPETV